MFEEQRPQAGSKTLKIAPAPQAVFSPPVLALLPLFTPRQQATQQAGQTLTAQTLRPVAVQRQQVGPMFEALRLQREVMGGLSVQRQAVLSQMQQLRTSVLTSSVEAALQRQAAKLAPVAPLTRSPDTPAEWVQAAQLEVQRVQDPAQPERTRWMGNADRERHLGTLRSVGVGLARGFRADRGPALQRYAEYGDRLAALQRQPLTASLPRMVLAQVPPAERPRLQRAVDDALQVRAEQDAHDGSVLQLHALQRQLSELDQEAELPVMARIQARQGSGSPLPDAVRRQLEAGLNHDLSGVRVHIDAEADHLSKKMNALAFTTGRDIYFQAGRFDPNSQTGVELLAHEATHVRQQAQGQVGRGVDPDAGLEAEARATGQRLAQRPPLSPAARLSPVRVPRAASVRAVQRLSTEQSPAPLKANEQTWVRHYSGQAKGVQFRLTVQRDKSGHLHARYKVTPGHRKGWHLEGQIRKDNSFVLHGKNGATFVGRFQPGGEGLTAAFHRGTAFTVDQLHLKRDSAERPAAKVVAPAVATRPAIPPRPMAAHPSASGPTPTPSPQPARRAAPSPATRHPAATPPASAAQRPQAPRVAEPPSGMAPPTDQPWKAQHTGMKGFDEHPEVQAAILWGAQQLRVDPNQLAATIGYETSGSFNPAVENEAARLKGKQGAVGLIQFTPSVGIPSLNEFLQTKAGKLRAKALGISATAVTRAGLMKMTPMEQMRYVVLYFNIPLNVVPAGATYDRIYQEILAPGRDGDVWYTKGTDNYEKNKQFDTNKDGKITRFEAASVLRKQGVVVNYFAPGEPAAGAQRPAATKPAASKPVTGKPAVSAPHSEPPATKRQTGKPTVTAAQPAKQSVKTVAPAQVDPRMGPQGTFDERVTRALTSFTQSYRFPVTLHWQEGGQTKEKTLEVQTPYYINAGSIQATVRAHRAAMSAVDRALFQAMPAEVRLGKASPEQMRAAAQLVAHLNPFGVSPDKMTGGMLTAWLKKYGLGVDCSGFVSQALDYATTQVGGHDPHIGDARVRVNRASGSLHGQNDEFQKIASPGEVRPGDTMWLSGHIRIVLQVGPGPGGKGAQMMIAESTPNTQLPEARAHGVEDLLGVDRSIWWFADASKFTKAGMKKKTESYNWDALPTDKWEIPNTVRIEKLYFSRYQPLAQSRKP